MHSEFFPMAENTNPIGCPIGASTSNFDLFPFLYLGDGVTLAACAFFENDNDAQDKAAELRRAGLGLAEGGQL